MEDLDAAYDRALGRFYEVGFERLDETDRLLVTLWGLKAEVNNGGFEQYYTTSSGDQACWAPGILRTIGAHAIADIVERANAVFGPDGPSARRSVREAQVQLVAPDNRPGPWDALNDQFYAYPWAYVDEFVEPFLRASGHLAAQ